MTGPTSIAGLPKPVDIAFACVYDALDRTGERQTSRSHVKYGCSFEIIERTGAILCEVTLREVEDMAQVLEWSKMFFGVSSDWTVFQIARDPDTENSFTISASKSNL